MKGCSPFHLQAMAKTLAMQLNGAVNSSLSAGMSRYPRFGQAV